MVSSVRNPLEKHYVANQFTRNMRVCVRVPASIANLGPGFDVFALALKEPTETVKVVARPSEYIVIKIVSKGRYRVPEDPYRNTAGLAARKYLEDLDITGEFTIELDKNIRPGGGLGSSAASAAGVVYALNSIYNRIDVDSMIKYASYGETVSSGAVHYDNVSASVLGGMVVNDGNHFLKISACDLPIAVATPSNELKTMDSRNILGDSIPFPELSSHISASTLLLHAFMKKDHKTIGKFVNSETVVERRRASLIRGYAEVKRSALSHGAYGVSISGAGPSVFAIAPEESLKTVGAAMVEAFHDGGVEASFLTTKSSDEGSLVIE